MSRSLTSFNTRVRLEVPPSAPTPRHQLPVAQGIGQAPAERQDQTRRVQDRDRTAHHFVGAQDLVEARAGGGWVGLQHAVERPADGGVVGISSDSMDPAAARP